MAIVKRLGALFALALIIASSVFLGADRSFSEAQPVISRDSGYHPDPQYWQLNGTKIEYYLRGEASNVEAGDPAESASLDLKFAADISDVFENSLKVTSTTTVIKASSDHYPAGASETHEESGQKGGESLTYEDLYITGASITEPSDLQVTSLPTIILLYLDSVPAAGTKSISAQELGFSGASGSQTITVTLNHKLSLPQPPYEALSKPPVLDTVRIATTLDLTGSSQQYCAATKETTTVNEKLHVDQEVYIEMNTGLLVYYKDARAGKTTSSCSEYNVDKSHLLAYSLTSWNVEFTNTLRVEEISNGLQVSSPVSGSIFRRGDKDPRITVTVSKNLESSIVLGNAFLEVDILKPTGKGSQRYTLTYSPLKNLTAVKSKDGWIASWDWTGNWDGSHPRQDQSLSPDRIPIGVYPVIARVINVTDKRPMAVSGDVRFYPGGASGVRPIYVIFDYPEEKESFVLEPNAYMIHDYPSSTIYGYAIKPYVLHQFDPKILEDALISVKYDELTFISQNIARRPTLNVVDAAYSTTFRVKSNINYLGNGLLTKNSEWYDVVVAVQKGTGICVDYSGVGVAYFRALGIPSRPVILSGKIVLRGTDFRHAAVEAWYRNNWNHYDPTNDIRNDYENLVSMYAVGAYGAPLTQFYPEMGQWIFRPTLGYWAVSYDDASGESISNIYKRYSWIANFTDLKPDKPSYSPGDKFSLDVTVTNTGLVDITSNINIEPYYKEGKSYWAGRVWRTVEVDHKLSSIQVGSLKVGQSVTKTVMGTISQDSSANNIFLQLYYTTSDGTPIALASGRFYLTVAQKKPFILPEAAAANPSLDPQLMLNGEAVIFQDSGILVDNGRNGRFRSTMVSSQNNSRVEVISEASPTLPYVKKTFTVANLERKSQDVVLSIPISGYGDTVYTESTGAISDSRTNIDKTSNRLLFYSSKEGMSGPVTVFTSPKSFKITGVGTTSLDLTDAKVAYIQWQKTLEPDEFGTFIIYYSDRQMGSEDVTSTYAQLSNEIVQGGDSMLDITIQAPQTLTSASRPIITVKVENNGAAEENFGYRMNVNASMFFTANLQPISAIDKTGSVKIKSGESKSIPFELDIAGNARSNRFDIVLATNSGDLYRRAATIENQLDITLSKVTATMRSETKISAILKNTGSLPVHDVVVTVNPYGNLKLEIDSSRRFDVMQPSSQEELSWTVTPVNSGILPFEVEATSQDGGTVSASMEITSLKSVQFQIESPALQVAALKPGESRSETARFNVTNIGGSLAKDVNVSLMLPVGVTGTPVVWEIPTLGSGETKTFTTTITFKNYTGTAVGIQVDTSSGAKASGLIIIGTTASTGPVSSTRTETSSITSTQQSSTTITDVTSTTTEEPWSQLPQNTVTQGAVVGVVIILAGFVVLLRKRSRAKPATLVQSPSTPSKTQPETSSVTHQVPSRPPATEVRFCTNCGAQLVSNQAFCSNCGARITD